MQGVYGCGSLQTGERGGSAGQGRGEGHGTARGHVTGRGRRGSLLELREGTRMRVHKRSKRRRV